LALSLGDLLMALRSNIVRRQSTMCRPFKQDLVC
jgi:hypothetical protein